MIKTDVISWIVICIPSGVTDVEQRSVMESAEHANASEVYLIEEPR